MIQTFSIQFVSQITGINSHTIRAWEKRYHAVTPLRDKNGRRMYTQEHVDRLNMIHHLSSLGNPVSQIATLPDSELSELYQNFSDVSPGKRQLSVESQQNPKESVDVNDILQNTMLALNHYKLDIIAHELEKANRGLSPRKFALNLIFPLLVEIGDQVERQSINVAQEHALSAILRFHIGHMLHQVYQQKSNSQFHVLLSTPEGELHEFGIMIAALLCSHYKIRFTYLGPNMPAESLAEAAQQLKPNLVILGCSRSYLTCDNQHIYQYVQTLAQSTPDHSKVWVGGLHKSHQWKELPNVDFVSTFQSLDRKLSELI